MKLTGVKLSKQQIEALVFIRSRSCGLINYGTGVGKSLIAIGSVIIKFKLLEIDKAVIVGTRVSIMEINNDWLKFTDYKPEVAKNSDSLEPFMSGKGKVLLCTYGDMKKAVESKSFCIAMKDQRAMVVADEVHKLKNPLSGLSQKFATVRKISTLFFGFSATNIGSKLEDLYYITSYISPGCLGTLYSFRENYMVRRLKSFYKRGAFGKLRKMKVWVTDSYQNLDQLYDQLKGVMISYFPQREIDYQVLEGELTNEKEYSIAADGYANSTSQKDFLARRFDLQKVVNQDPSKLALLKKSLSENRATGSMVYCSYYDSIDLVSQNIPPGLEVIKITGKMKNEDIEAAKNKFNSDPKGKVLIVSPIAGASMNLHSTNHLIFFDIMATPGNFVQVIGRVVRSYSSYTKFRITFICLKGTIDEYKMIYLRNHRELFQSTLKNEVIPPSEFEQYSGFLLEQVRKEMMWRTQPGFRKNRE